MQKWMQKDMQSFQKQFRNFPFLIEREIVLKISPVLE